MHLENNRVDGPSSTTGLGSQRRCTRTSGSWCQNSARKVHEACEIAPLESRGLASVPSRDFVALSYGASVRPRGQPIYGPSWVTGNSLVFEVPPPPDTVSPPSTPFSSRRSSHNIDFS